MKTMWETKDIDYKVGILGSDTRTKKLDNNHHKQMISSTISACYPGLSVDVVQKFTNKFFDIVFEDLQLYQASGSPMHRQDTSTVAAKPGLALAAAASLALLVVGLAVIGRRARTGRQAVEQEDVLTTDFTCEESAAE